MSDTAAESPTPIAPDRSIAVAFGVLRILFGLVFLSNGLAKVFNVSVYQVGPFAFTLVSRDGAAGILAGAVDNTWIPPLAAIYRSLVLPNFGGFQWFLTVAELAVGVALLLGVASRLAALVGLALIGPIWVMLLNEPLFLWEYPVELVPLLLLAIVPSGRTVGVDARFPARWPF